MASLYTKMSGHPSCEVTLDYYEGRKYFTKGDDLNGKLITYILMIDYRKNNYKDNCKWTADSALRNKSIVAGNDSVDA